MPTDQIPTMRERYNAKPTWGTGEHCGGMNIVTCIVTDFRIRWDASSFTGIPGMSAIPTEVGASGKGYLNDGSEVSLDRIKITPDEETRLLVLIEDIRIRLISGHPLHEPDASP